MSLGCDSLRPTVEASNSNRWMTLFQNLPGAGTLCNCRPPSAPYFIFLKGSFLEESLRLNMVHINIPNMRQGNASGIDVLIVGGGIGGLFCAVEMHRQGHTVRVLESKKDLDVIGSCPRLA